MIDDKLNEIFDIESTPNQSDIIKNVPPVREDIDEDIEAAKKIHRDLMEKSQDALDNLIEFAKASESPRAYEVVANLIKTTSEVAKTLVEIKNKETKAKPEIQNNTQNNLFVGSTAELQKFLKGQKEDV
jgi:3-polyprenyl-4-hydroxybenzoate decarboxylase